MGIRDRRVSDGCDKETFSRMTSYGIDPNANFFAGGAFEEVSITLKESNSMGVIIIYGHGRSET